MIRSARFRSITRHIALWHLTAMALILAAGPAAAQLQFESEPINYQDAPVHDRIAQLQQKVDKGEIQLSYEGRRGYLRDVLRLLEVPPSSQALVFSQTSFQLRKISPHRPRAVYFNDDTYVGWVQGGDVIEFAAVDPQQGAIFYTLDQQRVSQPKFLRDRGQCMTCHASSRTQGVPGLLIRSVYADADGRPQLGSGTFTTDHRSPFTQRWGGWYVSGTHGKLRHMGNCISRDRSNPEAIDIESGANRTDLKELVDTTPYLKPTSDIVALMVMEHQTQMHNYITLANFETRHAQHYDRIMNKALGRPEDYQSESTGRRIVSAAEKLVRYMLLVDEFQLTSPVKGVSEFAAEFSSLGPRDSQDRSLRQLDLSSRLFKYPCSYLIYSDAFDSLPALVKQEVYRRLLEVLSGSDQDAQFEHLSSADRTAIREILTDTKPDFPSS